MFVAFDTAAGTAIPKPFERELKVLLSPDRHPEIKGFTFVLSTLAPNGGCTDFHCHPESGELMIFLSGTGTAWFLLCCATCRREACIMFLALESASAQ